MARSSRTKRSAVLTVPDNEQDLPSIDARIKLLKPGAMLLLSETCVGRTFVERSGRGDKLRFVREMNHNGKTIQDVFKETRW